MHEAQLICYWLKGYGNEKDKFLNHQVGGVTLSPHKIELIKRKLAEKHHTHAQNITIVNVIPMTWKGRK